MKPTTVLKDSVGQNCCKPAESPLIVVAHDWSDSHSSDAYITVLLYFKNITYLPHKAVAEVSKDKEPIGKGWAEFKWFESQLTSDANELRVKRFWLSIDLRFKWFGCQSTCASNDFWLSADLNFKSCGCQQVILLSIDLRFKWFGCQSIWDSNELVVDWFESQMIWMSNDLRFKWFGCQLMCDSNGFGCQLMWDSSDLDFECFEIQVSWFSTEVWFKWFWLWVDVRFKWFGIRMFWDSIELVVNWFEVPMTWLSIDVCFKWFWLLSDLRFRWVGCQLMCDSNDFGCQFDLVCDSNDFVASSTELVVSWFEIRLIWLSNGLRFNWFGCQLMCDFQWFGCELDVTYLIWGSNDLVVNRCEFQMILGVNWFAIHVILVFDGSESQLWLRVVLRFNFSARLPWKMTRWRSKTKLFCETSFKNDTSTRHLASELQYVLAIFKRILQNSTAPATKKLRRGIWSPVTATWNDHCKVTLPWHEICNPSTDSASEASNIDIRKHEIPAPATRNASFRSLFKSTTPANVFATLTNSCACHVFCNASKSLRLPRENHFERPKTSRDRQFLTILTSESLSRAGAVQILRRPTSKSAPGMPRFNDFDFQIALARRRGANFVDVNFENKSAPGMPRFNDFDFQIALARRRGANFVDVNFQKCSRHASF